jgi:uncharacterized protein YjbI with pentapeptide repeats
MEPIEIADIKNTVNVRNASLDDSRFICASLQRLYFEDVTMAGTKITNANLSNLEIDGAQMGGAYIHNIGMPPEGHPFYNASAKQEPLRFENCDLSKTTFTNCNLNGIDISDCNLDGMKINGVMVMELLKNYNPIT